ncbi:MAG TPA: TerC family protein [Xanthobacteraceae bacterium]|nr:TerC family protein [Xanthobacteraceae bacterium]
MFDWAAIVEDFTQPAFWASLLQMVWINILLSGDNAVVIALACRALPPRERMWGMIIGAGFASILLIVFTGIISMLMTLPYLRVVGALALFWIAIKLLAPQRHDEEDTPEAVEDLWRAVWIVLVADLVMSLDNVIAVAAVAKGHYVLLAIGLAISIPIVIAGSALILALLERFPILVWGGAGILGWVAGDIFAGDPFIEFFLGGFNPNLNLELIVEIAGALLVLVSGYLWQRAHHAAVGES